jgi:hypothetical protein
MQLPRLTLSPPFTTNLLGWSVLTTNLQVYNVTATLPGDDALQAALAAMSRAARNGPSSNPQLALPPFLKSLGVKDMDTLYGLAISLGSSTWTDIPGSRPNVVTGLPASAGKITPSGVMTPTPADGVLAGFPLPLPAISIGKRFSFSDGPDLHFYIYVDKDAFSRDLHLVGSGGGVGFEGKTSDGTVLKLRLGAGRDQAGGGAGFIRLQIGPDFIPMAATP